MPYLCFINYCIFPCISQYFFGFQIRGSAYIQVQVHYKNSHSKIKKKIHGKYKKALKILKCLINALQLHPFTMEKVTYPHSLSKLLL